MTLIGWRYLTIEYNTHLSHVGQLEILFQLFSTLPEDAKVPANNSHSYTLPRRMSSTLQL
jgi:hypothetical protein